MSQRITDFMIHRLIEVLRQQGMDLALDGQYGRWRVTTESGSRDLSPRGSNREIYDWLHAYREGFDAGRRSTRGMEYERGGGDSAGVRRTEDAGTDGIDTADVAGPADDMGAKAPTS